MMSSRKSEWPVSIGSHVPVCPSLPFSFATHQKMPHEKLKSSIAIVGAGDVGASIAYSLLLNPIANEIILIDPKEDLLQAQVRDLGDATFRGNTGIRVKAGTHKEASQADIVVITAGAKQKKGEST